MYYIILFLHSWLRWLVLTAMILSLFLSFYGFLTNKYFGLVYKRIFVGFRILLGIQVLIGLILYFIVSPLTTHYLYHDIRHVVDFPVSFFTLIHPSGMFIAFIWCKMEEQKAEKCADSKGKFKIWALNTLVIFFIVMMTIPWPFYTMGRALFL